MCVCDDRARGFPQRYRYALMRSPGCVVVNGELTHTSQTRDDTSSSLCCFGSFWFIRHVKSHCCKFRECDVRMFVPLLESTMMMWWFLVWGREHIPSSTIREHLFLFLLTFVSRRLSFLVIFTLNILILLQWWEVMCCVWGAYRPLSCLCLDVSVCTELRVEYWSFSPLTYISSQVLYLQPLCSLALGCNCISALACRLWKRATVLYCTVRTFSPSRNTRRQNENSPSSSGLFSTLTEYAGWTTRCARDPVSFSGAVWPTFQCHSSVALFSVFADRPVASKPVEGVHWYLNRSWGCVRCRVSISSSTSLFHCCWSRLMLTVMTSNRLSEGSLRLRSALTRHMPALVVTLFLLSPPPRTSTVM